MLQTTNPRPSILALPFSKGSDGAAIELLCAAEQDALLAISRVITVRRGSVLYPEGGESRFIYNVISGVVETYRLLANGDKRVTAFLFPRDLIGMSEEGRYTDTAQALTATSAFKIPIDALGQILNQDPHLDIALLCKVCHELRRSQHHAVVVSQRDAAARVASFLLWMAQTYTDPNRPADELSLPMIRHDIADYLGMTLESVSRALHTLESRGLIQRRGPRVIVLLDRKKLQDIAAA